MAVSPVEFAPRIVRFNAATFFATRPLFWVGLILPPKLGERSRLQELSVILRHRRRSPDRTTALTFRLIVIRWCPNAFSDQFTQLSAVGRATGITGLVVEDGSNKALVEAHGWKVERNFVSHFFTSILILPIVV
jgi:hypothetical protein